MRDWLDWLVRRPRSELTHVWWALPVGLLLPNQSDDNCFDLPEWLVLPKRKCISYGLSTRHVFILDRARNCRAVRDLSSRLLVRNWFDHRDRMQCWPLQSKGGGWRVRQVPEWLIPG